MPDQSAIHGKRRRRGGGFLLAITRIWIPLAIAVAGIVAIIIGGGQDDITAGAGVSLVLAALIVWMINWMYRISVQSNRDREREEEAREYFDRHGRWPDE
ncbi:MAG: hypothetical protein ACLQA5_23860 [Solirubrobacteraceae bacterium]